MAEPWAAPLRAGFGAMVRHGLAGVWVRGRLPTGPTVWAGNHHSWWDPFVAGALLRRAGRRAGLLMRQDNLERHPYLRGLGVFGTDEARHGVDLLRAGRVVVVYPEGELRPAGPPGPLAPGAAWYAQRAP
ncbi:MAG: 1-acyl-sn-glycerol-3-phosphate acyltransferase, partial [Actinocatenispora sp.]